MGMGGSPTGSRVFWTFTDWWYEFILMHSNCLVCPHGPCEGLLVSSVRCAVLRKVHTADLGILIILLGGIFMIMVLEKCSQVVNLLFQ